MVALLGMVVGRGMGMIRFLAMGMAIMVMPVNMAGRHPGATGRPYVAPIFKGIDIYDPGYKSQDNNLLTDEF